MIHEDEENHSCSQGHTLGGGGLGGGSQSKIHSKLWEKSVP